MRLIILVFLTATLVFSSCVSRNSGNLPSEAEGYSPIYAADASVFKQIQAEPARTTINGGKIYTVGNLLFQVEQDSGIHIINYSNPSSPQKLGFIKSFLCKELAVKNGFIYLLDLQLAGRKRMTVEEFLRGFSFNGWKVKT